MLSDCFPRIYYIIIHTVSFDVSPTFHEKQDVLATMEICQLGIFTPKV